LFCFNEIVILSSGKEEKTNKIADLTITEFFVKNLENLETPHYLRKMLSPMHAALRFTSLMNTLDTPHHMPATEWCEYREGVVINRPVKKGKGSWVNIGINKDC
jgi:predicted SPOUT superfamily RNA methylase MTH1